MIARSARLVLVVLAALFALPAAAYATTPGVNGRIVFSSNRDGTLNDELYSVAADGTTVTRLTWSLTGEQNPAWSPDGTKIAFDSSADLYPTIRVMNADGTDERRVSPEGENVNDTQPAWSPDGSQIAFASTRPFNQSWHIWVMNADGSGLHQVTSEFSTSPAWSPDGTQLAFVRMNETIGVVNMAGNDVRQVTFPPAGYSDGNPSWSPDGTQLAFARRATWGSSSQLHVADADGSNERQLTLDAGVNRFPAWSPDGAQIVFTQDQHVSVIGSDGSGMRALTSVGRDLTVDWGTSTAIPGPRPPGPPTITIYSPENRLYPAGYDVHAVYICESATSFVISCEGDVPFGSLLDMDTTGRRTFTVRATDLDGRASTKTATFEVFDWRAPTVVVHTPADGAEYGLGESVVADYECFDEQGGSGIELCDGDLKRGQPVFMTQVGSFTSHFWAVDRAHNVTFASVTYTVVDRTPPPPPPPPTTITIESPQEGAIYVLGEAALARFDCQYAVWCRGSVPSGLQLDTWSVGAKTFTVRAGVHGGNDVIMSRSYRVVYPFSGFSSPLALFPGFVTLKAGTKVPAKFSLGGDFGLGVVTGSKWTRVSCATGTPFGDSSPTDAGGKLSFPSGRYQLLVVTNASWAGSCRQLAVALDDGTTHLANVTFD